jgi:hypothetical protein
VGEINLTWAELLAVCILMKFYITLFQVLSQWLAVARGDEAPPRYLEMSLAGRVIVAIHCIFEGMILPLHFLRISQNLACKCNSTCPRCKRA